MAALAVAETFTLPVATTTTALSLPAGLLSPGDVGVSMRGRVDRSSGRTKLWLRRSPPGLTRDRLHGGPRHGLGASYTEPRLLP